MHLGFGRSRSGLCKNNGLYVVDIIAMDWRIAFLGCVVVFIIKRACSSELSPPQRVKVSLSVLTWDHLKDHINVTYTVQYNTTLNDWRELYVGPQQQFDFSETAEDFYGKRFRVRSERENQTSDWVLSKRVQCAHLHTCAPVIELKVESDKVHLWMKHRDQSLKENEGGHIVFRPLYWKRNLANAKQEPNDHSAHLILTDLEPGQEYCFQAEYLLFQKPHGKPSREICEVIPESSKQQKVRVIVIGVLAVAGFATLGICLYYAYTHYKRIKALLQPPLEIPYHVEEFLFSEFCPHPVVHPPSQESFELVTCVNEVAEDKDHDKENSSSP